MHFTHEKATHLQSDLLYAPWLLKVEFGLELSLTPDAALSCDAAASSPSLLTALFFLYLEMRRLKLQGRE